MKFLFDFFPVLLFFAAYKLYGIFAATAVAIVASFVQVGAFWLRHRRFENMHLISLALITVLGGATLLLQDKEYFMWKPTVINWLFAAVFLASQYVGAKPIIARMMDHAVTAPPPVWQRLNFAWVLFFLALGAANLYVANFYFEAAAALNQAAGVPVDVDLCLSQEGAPLRALCQDAKSSEERWVDFKLFGMMGLTFLFVIAQGFYIARFIPQEQPSEEKAG